MSKEKDTKEKILEVANVLFAQHGYSGTSIRDIAKEAEVNIAAINYHFKNKQMLYHHLIESNHAWLREGMESLAKDNPVDTKEFTWKAYNFLLNHSHEITNGFKIHLNSSMEVPESCCMDGKLDFGPPGGAIMYEVITKEIGENIPAESRLWATRSIFIQIIHLALLMSTSMLKQKMGKHHILNKKFQQKSLDNLVDAILNYTKEKPDMFS